jgi:hypothetical protein
LVIWLGRYSWAQQEAKSVNRHYCDDDRELLAELDKELCLLLDIDGKPICDKSNWIVVA